ncbi:hypothetical protein NDN08_002726 [Rhodosorus marinus]|uniref:Alpha-carbonic anhydrase domain-containing protein n=1 Tax=Rhodosorus marinus TaxID=101924 RepID=A0AAV8UYT9_9RHOD|nr:hypothetical protein NDN08_002726 [Rhodosorus marinus]
MRVQKPGLVQRVFVVQATLMASSADGDLEERDIDLGQSGKSEEEPFVEISEEQKEVLLAEEVKVLKRRSIRLGVILVLAVIIAVAYFVLFVVYVARGPDRNTLFVEGKNESQWTYLGNTAPPFWGSLDVDADFSACDVGSLQSPIDISPGVSPGFETAPDGVLTSVSQVVSLPETINYEVLDHGNNITYFRCTQAICGTLRIPGGDGSFTEFPLSELHLHSPSESSLFSLHASMELQFFFISGEQITGIFSVLYRSLAVQGNQELGLLVEDGIRANYSTDTVTGTVSTASLEILEVGGDQAARWYEFVGYPGNSRPTQDLRGRAQTLFTSTDTDEGVTPEPDLLPST